MRRGALLSVIVALLVAAPANANKQLPPKIEEHWFDAVASLSLAVPDDYSDAESDGRERDCRRLHRHGKRWRCKVKIRAWDTPTGQKAACRTRVVVSPRRWRTADSTCPWG